MEKKGWVKRDDIEIIVNGREASSDEIKMLRIVDGAIENLDEFVKSENARLLAVYVDEEKADLYDYYHVLLAKKEKIIILPIVVPKKPIAIINENLDDKYYLMRVVDLWRCETIDSVKYHRKKYNETLELVLAKNNISKDDIIVDYCDGYRQKECEFLCWEWR